MTDSGYGNVSLNTVSWAESERRKARTVALTEKLGCQHTTVTGYRLQDGEVIELPAEDEQLCIPIDGTEPAELCETVRLSPDGVGRVPAGTAGVLSCSADSSLIVVGASAPPDSGECKTLSLADCEFTLPSTSDIATARLTRLLGSQGMKVNARLLEPGDVVPYHTEGDQEELFVPVSGPASMRIADNTVETPPGTIVRVAPEIPRSALNDGETEAVWVMIGAPPTGGPDEWDPGATILE